MKMNPELLKVKVVNGYHVSLEKIGHMYQVKVDDVIYKKTANQLFAVQAFNEI